jgi:hypothetical protein
MRKLICRWFGHSWEYGFWFMPIGREQWERRVWCRCCKAQRLQTVGTNSKPLDVVETITSHMSGD